jgi:hypothetical protein
MKLRLLKEWNGKQPGNTGVFLSEYGEQMIKDGIAELLDEDFVVEDMPKKEDVKQEPVYIPIPVPAEYFQSDEEENITKPKNK